MADEIRIQANERFDLVDMTRMKAFIQEALADIFGDLLGNHMETSGAAEDWLKRPLMARRPSVVHVNLTFTVSRQWTYLTNTLRALLWDKDGARVFGPNSVLSRDLVVAAAPGATTRYLQVRRVATDDTPETRRFYNETTGKYTQTINTRTIDDWELQENANSATTDAALASAGWIDLATFQTNGTTAITTMTQVNATWERGILSWATPGGAGPLLANIGEALYGLYQVVSRLRYGAAGRDALYDPNYDASFEVEGGLRLAGGVTAAQGLVDTYLRASAPASGYDVVTARPNVVSTPDDLHHYRAAGVFAGGDLGVPDTTNRRGFCYSGALDVDSPGDLQVVQKPWHVHPGEYFPTSELDSYTPYLGYGVSPPFNEWYVQSADFTLGTQARWYSRINSASASVTTKGLLIPLRFPHLCKVPAISIYFKQTETLDSNEYFRVRVYRKAVLSATEERVLGGQFSLTPPYDDIWDNTPSTWLPGIGSRGVIEWFAEPTAADFIPDNDSYDYWLAIYHGATSGGITDKTTLLICDTTIHTNIREASHVY